MRNGEKERDGMVKMKFIKSIKRHSMTILIAMVVILFASNLLQRGCNGRKIAELEGQLQVSESTRKEEKKEVEKISKRKDENTAKLEEEIQDIKLKLSKSDEKRKEYIETDREKADEIYLLKEQAERLTDPDSIADNWKIQAETWESRFWNERKDKDEVIKQRNWWAATAFKQYNKYLNEHTIRKSLDKQLAITERNLETSNELNTRYKKKISGFKLKMNVKNVLYTVGGFVVGVIAE